MLFVHATAWDNRSKDQKARMAAQCRKNIALHCAIGNYLTLTASLVSPPLLPEHPLAQEPQLDQGHPAAVILVLQHAD